jgi:signal peptidase I
MGRKKTGARARREGWWLLVALVAAVGVGVALKTWVIDVYRVTTASVEPDVLRGARAAVFKLGRAPEPGDVVIFRDASGAAMAGRVEAARGSGYVVAWNDSRRFEVDRRAVVGRVVFSFG